MFLLILGAYFAQIAPTVLRPEKRLCRRLPLGRINIHFIWIIFLSKTAVFSRQPASSGFGSGKI